MLQILAAKQVRYRGSHAVISVHWPNNKKLPSEIDIFAVFALSVNQCDQMVEKSIPMLSNKPEAVSA